MKIDKLALELSTRWNIQQIKHWFNKRFQHIGIGLCQILKSLCYITWALLLLLLSPLIVTFIFVYGMVINYNTLSKRTTDVYADNIRNHIEKGEGFVMKTLIKIIKKLK